jgi:hypothetical protein
MSMATLDWSQCHAVESVPGNAVSAIFENIAAGANIDDILEWFDGLDREQVKAVLARRTIAIIVLGRQQW